jgi:hypothetical protein
MWGAEVAPSLSTLPRLSSLPLSSKSSLTHMQRRFHLTLQHQSTRPYLNILNFGCALALPQWTSSSTFPSSSKRFCTSYHSWISSLPLESTTPSGTSSAVPQSCNGSFFNSPLCRPGPKKSKNTSANKASSVAA